MTSRTPMGVQPRQPQRTLSSSSLSAQRSSHQQRTLSQQLAPSSPVRKDAFVDLTGDGAEPSHSRHASASTPRRAGSRLKLELSNEGGAGVASAVGSPQSLTSSRVVTVSEAVDGGNPSPALSRTSQQDIENPPMPMPKRRSKPLHHVQESRKSAVPPPPTRKDARPKPYTIEVPASAPRFSSAQKHDPIQRNDANNRDPFSKGLFSGHADFFPWSGIHHEDEWNAEAIQKGTWDKGNQNETSSARLAIFPALKQKTGLSALSTIFMGVLNQRRHRGQITVPSTFKPPPRVTLTDTKREVWLKDLANPAISLRRLSRTIPHGIRGRTLLDQCLNKNVPTERAVWLAKCVGANEIRAFKRKGVNGAFVMGGEVKWIRDWTVFVEQFVDAIVASFGESDWKAKVNYAIRLATNLYTDHLLDRDHYLDWIVSGLENTAQSRMPMWILIAQIYWADLLSSRKFGRRLAFCLLAHLSTIHDDPDRDILIQLSSRLTILLKDIARQNPSNFISPDLWIKYREISNLYLHADDPTVQVVLDEIHARNAQLVVANTAMPRAGRAQLVKMLDTTMQTPMEMDFPMKCWAACEDKRQAVKTVVEWAVSPHRPGLTKIYVATTILRSWATFRCDPTPAILRVIDETGSEDQSRKRLVYHLSTELARTRHFSAAQYLQWLIARGGYYDASQIDEIDGSCGTRLLLELPVYCLSDRARNDRANLLRRAGYLVANEEQDISNALKYVKHSLGLALPADDPVALKKPMALRKLLPRLRMSSRTLQSAVGAELRDIFTSSLSSSNLLVVSTGMFSSVRLILEAIEDYAMLADVLRAVARSSDMDTLALCADTVNANLGVLLALGAADDLFEALVERMKASSQEQGIIPRPLLAALTNLAPRLPHREETAKQLLHELVQSDRTSAIDACSPVSDSNLPNATQNGDGDVSEEIDKLLASGNTIDQPTMNRFFRNIVPKLESGWAKMDDSRRVFASLLTRLRIFDMKHFDRLMSDWISHIRTLTKRQSLTDLYPLLVSLGCVSVQTLLNTANASPPKTTYAGELLTSASTGVAYLQDLLQLIMMELPPSVNLSPEELYAFNIQQQAAKSDHSKSLLLLIRNAVLEYAGLKGANSEFMLPLDDEGCLNSTLDTLRVMAVVDSTAVAETLSPKTMPAGVTNLIQKIVTKLLLPEADGDVQTSFEQVLDLANELTMPFCHLKLNFELSIDKPVADEVEQQGLSRFDLFAHAMDQAIEARNIMWTSMIPCLSEDITQHLKNQAHGRFLSVIPSSKSPTLFEDATSEERIHLAENLLGVVEAIISGLPPSKSAQLTGVLAEKLSDLWEIITPKDQDDAAAQSAVLQHWLPALLRFITIHSTSETGPVSSNVNANIAGAGKVAAPGSLDARARIVLVLCGLLLDLERLPPQVTGNLPQQVFDIAILLVDAIPDDLGAQCARATLLSTGSAPGATTSSDPRLYYLFSAQHPTRADNLMLSHREKAAMPYSAAARGMGAMYGVGPAVPEKLSPFALRRWELLSEPTPNVGENDTSLSLGLFEAVKIQ